MATYLILKIVHIVGFVSWFAGLFYLGRMFVYHRESLDREGLAREVLIEQFYLMEQRVLKIIVRPAMLITWAFGLWMIVSNGLEWLQINGWLHAKLVLLLMLTYYSEYCRKISSQLKELQHVMSSYSFRLFNEVPTLFLIIISSLAVLKNGTNPLVLFLSIIAIIVALNALTLLYKKVRDRNPEL